MALPPLPGGSTRAQAIVFYASYLGKLPGVYQGSATAYDGMTWAALYETIANQDTAADPKALGDAVVGLWGAQTTGHGVAAATATLAPFITAAEKAVAQTNFAGPAGGLLGALGSIGDFFGRLTQANTWLRIGEAILAGGLILVGLAHLAGNTAAGRTARKIATRAALL